MKTISVCMIVKDEQEVIDRVLECASSFADEIIVVDTGSKDNTKNIALKYTDKVYDYKWCDDFSKARNYSLSLATSDYLMWLDADDVIKDSSITKLKQLKSKLSTEDVVMLPYQVAFDESGRCTFSYYRERIVKNNAGFWFVDPIHEAITPRGQIIYVDIPILHQKVKSGNPKRNLLIYQNLLERGVEFSARQQFYYANELYYNAMYEQAIDEYNKFVTMQGFVENQIQACLNRARCYLAVGKQTQAIQSLLASFAYDLPRSEVLCELGDIYTFNKDYKRAVYWYKLALQKPNRKTGGFVQDDKYTFVPCINLSVCYYYLGDTKRAVLYNNKALKYKPDNKTALSNKIFYDNLSRLN